MVDREFVNIYGAQLGLNFEQLASNLIQIGSDWVASGSHWPLWGQKWSWPVGNQNCENLISKVIIHCENKAKTRDAFQITCAFLSKVDFVVFLPVRERRDPYQLPRMRTTRRGASGVRSQVARMAVKIRFWELTPEPPDRNNHDHGLWLGTTLPHAPGVRMT